MSYEQQPLPLRMDPALVFTPNAPIDERSLFRGRIDQVRTVLRAVNQKGQHAILFGERGVGKTSLANVIASFLSFPAGDENVISPRVNCDSTDTFESVWLKVLEEISLSEKLRPAGFTESTARTYSAAELLPGTVSPDSVRRALTVLSRYSVTILIIDEFDRLDRATKRAMADTIKTLSDHAVPVTVVLVGVADSVSELIEEHESVERALVQVHMPRMSYKEIEQVIIGGLAKLELVIDSGPLQRICTLAQGLPHYAHLIGLEASAMAIDQQRNELTLDLLTTSIEIALKSSQASIRRMWNEAITSPRKDNLFSDVLIACALAKTDELGYFAPQDVRFPLSRILERKVEIANYAQHLSDFCDKRRGPVLQRIGEKRRFRFRFVNPLMQPFVVMQGFANSKISDALLNESQ